MDPPNYLKLLLLLALSTCVDSTTNHDVFDELTRSESYDKRIIPQGKDGDSLTVSVSLYVLSIVDMTETGYLSTYKECCLNIDSCLIDSV